MLITDFTRALERIVPLSSIAFDGDRVGMQVGLPSETLLSKVLFAYEVTTEVIAEARDRDANLIVAFHPLIFPNITSVTDTHRTGALLRELLKADIALYVQHTAFDAQIEFGTSRLMAEALKLQNIQPLTRARESAGGLDFGMGAIGSWEGSKTRDGFLQLVQQTFGTPAIRTNADGPSKIKTVAMLGGAGMEYYSAAKDLGADAFITADVRYHDFHRASHDKILLVDAGHAETERFVTGGMVQAARRALELSNMENDLPFSSLLPARTEPNSVRYYCQD